MDNGGKIYVVLGDADKAQPNLKSFLKKYGIQEVSGYIADTQRSYQEIIIISSRNLQQQGIWQMA